MEYNYDNTTTTRFYEIEKMRYILSNNDYGILYDKKNNDNPVIFKKIDDVLWLRFKEEYPFDRNEFIYFQSHSNLRISVPWEHFSLVFQTLWFKFKYTHKFQGYLHHNLQDGFALIHFVKIIYDNESFQDMRNEERKSKILVIWQPQGSKSRVHVYFDFNLSEYALSNFPDEMNIKKGDDAKTISFKAYKNRVEMLGKILFKFGYRF